MKKRIVLVAHSERAKRNEITDWYQAKGFATLSADDGVQCVERLLETTPVLIVLDQNLRDGGAQGVLELIRKEPRWRTIPVLMSGRASSVVRQRQATTLARPVQNYPAANPLTQQL